MQPMPVDERPLAIHTSDLRVDYGDFNAASDLDLQIKRGEIFGLIGPNGAGKTSTIKVLATLLRPTYGEVYVGGVDVLEEARDVHRLLGYMPDLPIVCPELKLWEYLDMFAHAYLIPMPERKQIVERSLALTQLLEKRDTFTHELSRGMKQRLMLAKTLLHDPQVLILDEPAGGLDPNARIELRQVLRGLSEEGKTILISSHILTELSGFCTSVGIMERGRMVVHGSIDEIVAQMEPEPSLVVELLEPAPAAALSALRTHPDVGELEVHDNALRMRFAGDDTSLSDVLAELVLAKARVTAFYTEKMNLEDIFLEVGAKEVS